MARALFRMPNSLPFASVKCQSVLMALEQLVQATKILEVSKSIHFVKRSTFIRQELGGLA